MPTAENKPVSGLDAADLPLANTDLFYVVQSATTTGSRKVQYINLGLEIAPTSATDGHLAVFDGGPTRLRDGGAVPGGGDGRPTDPLLHSYVRDDFQVGNATSALIGELRWVIAGGTETYLASEANHPGIVETAGSVACGRFFSQVNSEVRFDDTFDQYWIVRIPATTNTTIRVGLAPAGTASTANPPPNGIYVERLNTDTNWFLVTRSGSVQTRVDTGVAGSVNFIRLRLRRIDANTIGLSVNGATEITSTTNIPTGSAYCFRQMIPSTGTQKLHTDFFDLLINVSR